MSTKSMHQELLNFQRRCESYIDDANNPVSQELRREVQALEDDAQGNKNAHSVEDRVKRVIALLERAGEHGAMSHHHADELKDQCEDFRRQLQKLR